MKRRFLVAAALTGALAAMPAAADDTASAKITDTAGKVIGVVSLVQGPAGVLVSADLGSLPPGSHGFHIHAKGSCTPDFKAAGGHFNPAGHGHGLLHKGGHHAGDLPNLQVGADGKGMADYFTPNVTLEKGAENSLFDADGSAIVIHAKPDSYGKSAGAGARIACGVIKAN